MASGFILYLKKERNLYKHMSEHSTTKTQTALIRIVLAVYIALSIWMCFNELLLQKDYQVFTNDDGLPELEE